MIKKPKGKRETIKYIRLYLDDIENIMVLLKENCEEIVVSGDGFELENPLQLNEYKELTQDQLNSLHIHTVAPAIHIFVSTDFIMSGVTVAIDDDTPKNIGIMEKILDILRRRQRNSVAFYQSFKAFLIITLILNVAILFAMYKFNLSHYFVLIILLGWMAFRWISCELPSMRAQLLLEKEYSHKNVGFLKRNKDQLILLAIGAIIGSLLTLLVEIIKSTIK